MKAFRQIADIFIDAFAAWNADLGPRQAAAMAYFTIFTIAPLLVVLTTLVGLFLGEARVRVVISRQLTDAFGADAAALIDELIMRAGHPGQGLISTLISIAMLVLGAIALFNHLQISLNIIWKVPQPTTRSEGILHFLRGKVIAFFMVLVAGALIVLSLIFNTMVAVFGRQILDPFPATEALVQTTNFLLSWVVSTLLFAMIYKFMPNAKTYWRDSLIGAAITTILFSFGRMALAWYFANAAPSSAFGAAGSLIAILLWVNYSAQIILYGAEFTHTFAKARAKQDAERKLPKNPFMP